MIGFLRDIFPSRVDAETKEFLIECLVRLPSERYGIYVKQIREGLLKYKGYSKVDHPSFRNYVTFTYEGKISVEFQDWNGRFWRVRNISVENRDHSTRTNVSLFFSHGLICGYAFEASRDFTPDPGSIDVSKVSREFFDSPDPIMKTLIPSRDQHLINWSDVYEVEFDGITYYHLRDLGDGDFIGIDGNGLFFEIRHDPLEVRGLEGTISEILSRY